MAYWGDFFLTDENQQMGTIALQVVQDRRERDTLSQLTPLPGRPDRFSTIERLEFSWLSTNSSIY